MSDPIPVPTPSPRRRRGLVWAAGLLALATGSVLFVKHKDQDNRFCISCHLHETIYRDMTGDSLVTLATAHYRARHDQHPERCFTCHSGEGVMGWSAVTALSAWDAARWVLGAREEPTHMRLPLTNPACLKCHPEVTRGALSEEETSKYHELANHRGVKMPCVDCHVTHTPGSPARHYLDPAVVRVQCQACHRNLGSESGEEG